MREVVYNNTSKPVITRRWWINQDTFGEDDAKWMQAFEMQVHIDQPTHTFDTYGGQKKVITGKPRIEVTTTTDKQRDMLMLKYGENLLLIHQFVTLPNMVSIPMVDN